MFEKVMFIYRNEDSFLFLLQAIKGAQRRIVCILWETSEGIVLDLFQSAIRNASDRGIRVVILTNPCFKFPFLSEENITIISCVSPSHSKVFVIDDLIISTDRNVENIYYRSFYRSHSSFDFVFSSSRIGNAIEDYVWNRGRYGFDISDGPYRFMIGYIRPFFDNLLSNQRELRILSGTFVPSLGMEEYLRTRKHQVIVGMTEDLSPDLFAFTERFFMTQGIVRYVKKLFHYKVFLSSNFAVHGSYNIDFISEVYNQEHAIVTTVPSEIQELSCLYSFYDKMAISPITVPLPLDPFIRKVAETSVLIWRKFCSRFIY